MSLISFMLFLLLIYALPLVVICVPVGFWSRSVRWRWWEFLLLIVPFAVWIGLVLLFDGKNKTLSSAVIEPLLAGCAACLPVIGRAVGPRVGLSRDVLYWLGMSGACLLVLATYVFVPALPE